MSVVTFCGHGEFYGEEAVVRWLRETVEDLIRRGADDFLLGGYGGFDACAASVVWDLKKKYPAIRSTLVLPYRHPLPAAGEGAETLRHFKTKRVHGK